MKDLSSQAVVSEYRDRMVSLVVKEKEALLVREAKEALRGSQDPQEGLGLL